VAPTFKRSFRGYNRVETDEFIAQLTKTCEAVTDERDGLNEAIEQLRTEQREHKRRTDQEANDLLRELTARERQVSDLERELRALTRQHEQQQAALERLGDELLRARADVQQQEDDRAELLARVGRIELRERVLAEQLTILKGELHQTRDPRAALDRLVETVTQEARQEAEVTLKKARAQAEHIVRSAEKRGRELEEAVETRTSEDLQRHLGEALWTSRHTPESRSTGEE
jgi:cell division septum initiation protein DivIVA